MSKNVIVCKSPYDSDNFSVKEILFQRIYKNLGYVYRKELIDDSKCGGDGNLPIKVCYSLNGDYIGDPKTARFLTKKKGIRHFQKINENDSVCSIGFNPEEQKWYGWSDRACYGFGIGSMVKRGDIAYKPSTVDELYDELIKPDEDGFAWQKEENVEKVESGCKIKHHYYKVDNSEPYLSEEEDSPGEVKYTGEICYDYEFIPIGKGEWTAETLEDAKQMAIDFANDVS